MSRYDSRPRSSSRLRQLEQASREEIDSILEDLPVEGRPPAWPPAEEAREPAAPVPVRLRSGYYWSPFNLLCGLAHEALPGLSGPAWKVCTAVGIRQMVAATVGKDARFQAAPIALSLGELAAATGLTKVTVIAAIRAAVEAGWLTQEKRRTPHGGNARALYSIDWRRAEQSERRRRKQKT